MGDFSQDWNRGVQQRARDTAQRRSEQSFWKGFENGQVGAKASQPAESPSFNYIPINWHDVFRILGALALFVGRALSFLPAGAGAVTLYVAKSRATPSWTLAQCYKACVPGVIAHAAISFATLAALFWTRTTERRMGHLIATWDGLTTLFDDPLIAMSLGAAQVAAFLACAFSIWWAVRPAQDATPGSGSALRGSLLSAAAVATTGLVLTACVFGMRR